MKVSFKWLKEWVNTKQDVNSLCDQLTFAGLEVDGVEDQSPNFTKVVVGQVKSKEQHPDADRLIVCQIVTDPNEPEKTIVCGAKNVYEGMVVPVAVPGARIGDKIKIKKSKLRGVPSEGMLCAAEELGLGSGTKGIMDLPKDAPLGADFAEYMQLGDMVIDLDLTPNRGDCFSIQGVAREVAALEGSDFTPVVIKKVASVGSETRNITLKEDACSKYCGRIIKNIKAGVSTPLWMQQRLEQCGVQPKSPVVDITNYVMLELGQPLHAFDLSKIEGDIQVRFANSSEKIELLDESEITLDEKSLVIADDKKALALAGVMGGANSAINDDTTDIFLESAFFNPESIARTSQAFKIITDSSQRFERGVDWQLADKAIERATELILEIVGGEPQEVNIASSDALPSPVKVTLAKGKVNKLLGLDIPSEKCEEYLTRLQMQPKSTGGSWEVGVPSFRFDVTRGVDLIEEIARLHGFNEIPASMPESSVTGSLDDKGAVDFDKIRNFLATNGFNEAINYSFTDPVLLEKITGNSDFVKLSNPVTNDMSVMRTSLLPGLLTSIQRNQARQQDDLRLFEIGKCYFNEEGSENIPYFEQYKVAIAFTQKYNPDSWGEPVREVDFYDLKGMVESLIGLSRKEFRFEVAEHAALHPGKSAAVYLKDELVGFLGEIHPKLARDLSIQGPVLLAELTWDLFKASRRPKMEDISKYPVIKRDLAFVSDLDVEYGVLQDAMVRASSKLLKSIELFDIYQGDKVEKGKKSFAVRLCFQHPNKTLVDTEVNQMVDAIIEHLQSHGATLRGP